MEIGHQFGIIKKRDFGQILDDGMVQLSFVYFADSHSLLLVGSRNVDFHFATRLGGNDESLDVVDNLLGFLVHIFHPDGHTGLDPEGDTHGTLSLIHYNVI